MPIFGPILPTAPMGLVRRRLYDNLYPYSYLDAKKRFVSAVVGNNSEYKNKKNISYDNPRDVTFATYLGISPQYRHTNKPSLQTSSYKPTKGAVNGPYYKHPLLSDNTAKNRAAKQQAIQSLVRTGMALKENQNVVSGGPLADVFSDYTVGKGYDKKGTYVSYYDLWDIAPLNNGGDESLGLGKPVRFYDRYYLDDVMGLSKDAVRGTHWLPEITVSAESPKLPKGVHSKEWYRKNFK